MAEIFPGRNSFTYTDVYGLLMEDNKDKQKARIDRFYHNFDVEADTKEQIVSTDRLNRMPFFHYACVSADFDVAIGLIRVFGPDVGRQVTVDRVTPLMLLCIYCFSALLKLSLPLVSMILEDPRGSASLNVKSENGDTALHFCLRHHDNTIMVEKLLAEGADFTQQNGNGSVPLQLASYCQRMMRYTFTTHAETLKRWRPIGHLRYPLQVRRSIRTLLTIGWARKKEEEEEEEEEEGDGSIGIDSTVCYPQGGLYLLPRELLEIVFGFLSDNVLHSALHQTPA